MRDKKKTIKYLKITLIYIVFFAIMYIEGQQISGLPISQLWKMPIIAYIMVYVITKGIRTYRFNKYAYGYGFVKLANQGILNTPFISISDFVRYSTFPFLFDYVKGKLKSIYKTRQLLFYIAQFVILSFIPFLFHLLDPPNAKTYQDTTIQEIIDEAGRMSGLFQATHGASEILSLCLLIIISKIQCEKLQKAKLFYLLFLITIGIWALISTYARGGWAMFIIGTLILVLRNNKKYIIGGTLIGILCFSGISYLMNTNEFFYNRITDRDIHGERKTVGSGRLDFAKNGFNFWLESHNLQEYLTGQGLDKLTDYQKEKTGLKIYCHNGYVDSLAQNGIIGFFCLTLSTFLIFKFIYKSRHERFSRFVFAIFSMRVVFQLVQGGASPYSDLIYVLVLCLLINSKRERIMRKITRYSIPNALSN